jgi:small-conductance mechanosensitive channel
MSKLNGVLAAAGPAALLALAAGGGCAVLAGFGAAWVLKGDTLVEVPVARAPTDAELEAACAPEVEPVQDELSQAQTRVAQLERESAEKEAKVNELEARIARGAEAGKALRAELAQVKAELAETQEALRVAEEEKEVLLAELTETKEVLAATEEALVVARDERDEAREDALYNRWTDFLKDSQLEICDKGNRKKLGNCREAVMETLAVDARRDAFAHCIRSGQAQPLVRELVKDAELPQFAQMIDEDTKQVKGWYVEMCDPTLPERTDAPLAEGRIPQSSASVEG